MNIECRRSHSRGRDAGVRRPTVERLETRHLLTSALQGTDVSAVAGQDATLTVLHFKSDSTLDVASATIDWGDGTPATSGVVQHLGLANPAFDAGSVTGDHTYQAAGSYTITVTALESGSIGSGKTATVTSTATVSSSAFLLGPVLQPQVVKGVAFDNRDVAVFHALASGAAASDFTATIDWGDGSATSAGTIVPLSPPAPVPPTGSTGPVAPPEPGGYFAVTGGHTYATSGSFTAHVTITDASGDSATTTAAFAVADSRLVDLPITETFRAVAGAATDGIPVTAFNDLGFDPSATPAPGDDTATIDWGDGTATSAGQISLLSDGNGNGTGAPDGPPTFLVQGAHTYASAGSFTATVTITDAAGDSITGTRTINVSALTLTAQGRDITVPAGVGIGPLVVALLQTDPADVPLPPGSLHATIDWGDGTTPTDGVIVGDALPPGSPPGVTSTSVPQPSGGSSGIHYVAGWHTYATAGSYTIHVAITGPGSASAQATATATVTSIGAVGVSFHATTNQPDQGQTVAVFPPASSTDTPDNYTATIDWGDGTTSAGTVSGGAIDPGGPPVGVSPAPVPPTGSSSSSNLANEPIGFERFQVSGDHTYTATGTYTVHVTITDKANHSVTTTASATVAADTITAFGHPVPAPVGQTSTLEVAGFRDAAGLPASAFTVMIDWGDGSAPTSGQVQPGPVAVPEPAPVPVSASRHPQEP